MITSNEYTRQSNRSNVIKVRKIGKTEPCVVIRVDEQNGYIDLSKKRVKNDEVASIEEKYAKGRTVQSIMRAVVEKTGEDIGTLYETIVWPLQEKYTHALDAFNEAHG
jgi:translation initiation factor 2 subunit 1